MKRIVLCQLGILTVLVGCGNMQAEDYLRADLKKIGFLPYEAPIKNAGTGTLVGGSPKEMDIYAPPERCFPDVNAQTQKKTEIRVLTPIDLPTKTTSYTVSGNARIGLIDVLAKGNSSIKAGVQFNKAQTIEFSFSAPQREYLDAVKLIPFYRNSMPENYFDPETGTIKNACKEALNKVRFIREALMIEGMSFKFYESSGGAIDLEVVDPKTLLEFGTGVAWERKNKYELTVKTKKYIGYKLGELRSQTNGVSFCTANSIDKNGNFEMRCESFPENSMSKALGYLSPAEVLGSRPKWIERLDQIAPTRSSHK
jgi:hypothetical protein